jgi:Icc-related predicted phosphoesterase
MKSIKFINLIITTIIIGLTSMTTSTEIAIISGINGNKTALESVMNDINMKRIDNIIVLGDICGIGARNNECIDYIRKLKNATCLAGKWEYHFSGKAQLTSNDPSLQWFLNWSKNSLTEENLQWISNLPTITIQNQWAGVPGRFDDGSHHQIILRVSDARLSFDGLYKVKKKLGFVGTTGVPVGFFDENPITYSQDKEFSINSEVGTIINVGSVGSPKDDNPNSRYMIYNGLTARTIEVPYDLKNEEAAMKKAGFPSTIIDGLLHGR